VLVRYNISDATVWKLKVGLFFGFSSRNRIFSFNFQKIKKNKICCCKLTIEIAVSVFDLGLQAKTECLCLLLRSMTYVILRSSRHKHHVTKKEGKKRSENRKLVSFKKKSVQFGFWHFGSVFRFKTEPTASLNSLLCSIIYRLCIHWYAIVLFPYTLFIALCYCSISNRVNVDRAGRSVQ